MDAALHHFEGVKPTPELMAKAGARVARLAEIDPSERGRAVKVGEDWRPRQMFRRGRLTQRQYTTARALLELHEAAFGPRLKSVDYTQPRVDASRRAPTGPGGMLDAARQYQRVMARLPVPLRAIVERIVLHSHTIASASLHASLDVCWLPPAGTKTREVCVASLLGAALEICADALCEA